jgi:predicted MFS family arabinose efflux permease
VPSSVRVITRIARDRRLRRIELGFAGFAIAEHGAWLAGILYAYDRGGVDEAGIAAVVLLAPTLVIAPLAAVVIDRFESGRVLAAGYAIQATAMLLAALAIATDVGPLPVYAAAMAAASAVTLTRPALGVVLPSVTHAPADLTAANVVTGFVEYSGRFIGPALTGILVGVSGLAAPFAVCGAIAGASAAMTFGVHTDDDVAGPGDGAGSLFGSVLRDTAEGLRALREHRPVRTMIGMLALGSLVIGAADVLVVATADQLSGGDTSRAGLFGTAFGVGAVIGSAVSTLLIGRARLTPAIAISVAAMGLSLALLATATASALALALFIVMGGGESVLRISASTLIQRVAPLDVIGRFLGVAEGLQMSAIAIGSGAIGLLVARFGYEAGLLAAGITVLLLLVVRLSILFQVDRDATVPNERVLELILGDDIFNALPAPTIERLAADVERYHMDAGDTIIAEGEPGDRYYVLESGRAQVFRLGEHVGDRAPGSGFGELALLGATPRTATVVAVTDVDLIAFDREPFLQAVTGHSHSAAVGRRRLDQYLGPDAG